MDMNVLYNILFIAAVAAAALIGWFILYGFRRGRKKKELDEKLIAQGRFVTGNAHQFNSLDRRR